MTSDRLILGYEITTDPDFLDSENAITPELKRMIPQYHEIALEGKKSGIPKLLKAIDRNPKNPQLKNYLSVLYTNCGDIQKAYDTNQWLVSEHPDYLFGKLNQASEYFQKEQYEKIPEILGEAMELKALYPNRDKFHLNEVTSFYKSAILYLSAIDDIDQAETRFEILEKIAPESEDTEIAFNHLMLARLSAGAKRMEEEEKMKIKVKRVVQKLTTKTEAPEFNHYEIEQLYEFDLRIEENVLKDILSLPRETLIQDLNSVLNDSIERFTYFYNLYENKELHGKNIDFVIHAFFLLGELKASESIELIFKIFCQSDEYLEFYFGDFLSDAIWEPVYKIAHEQLEKCKQFMFLPSVDSFAKSVIPDVVEQIANHQPKRREEIINWFKEIIDFFLKSKLEDNVIDSDVIALLICNIIDIKASILLPEIEQLFEKEIVSTGICGNFDDVEKAFKEPTTYSKTKEILSIAERYEDITSTWAGYRENDKEDYFSDYEDIYEPPIMPVRAEPKIGRNDPCPCGSGKKYKKCCLNKS